MTSSPSPMERAHTVRAVLSLVSAGALCEVAAALGIYPVAALAGIFATDGGIGSEFRALLEHAQQVLGLCLLVSAPLAALAPSVIRGIAERLTAMRHATFSAVLLLVAFALVACVQAVLFERHPHITDETCHLFQAGLLADGMLYAPLPPCPDRFFQHHMVMLDTGRWFSKYPPGQPLLLTPFVAMGIPWLAGPLCFAVASVLLSQLGILTFGVLRGRMLALLFASSPMALLLGASYMSHVPALCFLVLGILLLARTATRPGGNHAGTTLSAGVFIGLSALFRPQDMVIAALLGVLSLLFLTRAIRERVLRATPLLVPGVALAAAAWIAWNGALFGSFEIGYSSTNPHLMTPLFKDQVGFTDSYTPATALGFAALTCFRFNSAMTGWPVALLILPLALWRPERRLVAVFCAAATVAIMAAYSLYAYLGAEFEARYYTLALPFTLALLVIALENTWRIAARWFGSAATGWLAGLAAAFTLYAAGHYWPSYIAPKYGRDYEQSSPVIKRTVDAAKLDKAVVLVPANGPSEPRYSSVFHLNDPLLRGIVYVRDPGNNTACLRDAFADRPLYRFVPASDWASGMLLRVDDASE